MLVVTSDSEEGNKQGISRLRNEIEQGSIDPDVSFHLTFLVAGISKTCKESLSNWYLKLKNEEVYPCFTKCDTKLG